MAQLSMNLFLVEFNTWRKMHEVTQKVFGHHMNKKYALKDPKLDKEEDIKEAYAIIHNEHVKK